MTAGGPPRSFVEALREHDRALAERELEIWVGGEPTFTDRGSNAPEWTVEAAGEDKAARGLLVLAELAAAAPGAAVLRSLGRQYPGEALPRWSLGVYARRDGAPLWSGPPDPACGGLASADGAVRVFRDALAEALGGRAFDIECPDEDLPYRVLVAAGEGDAPDPAALPGLGRRPMAACPIALDGPRDELVEAGRQLVAVGRREGVAQVELPALHEVGGFVALLAAVAAAARAARLPGLVITGFPPPVDSTVAWTTVTPDPGVLELNMAPCAGVVDYHRALDALYLAATATGLSPERLFYNGDRQSSGGGGHITLGGPTPVRSPFFVHPRLLPRFIAYLQRHPALSFWFRDHAVGSASQAPRVDESVAEAQDELDLALALLERGPAPDPALLWESLAPFATDRFGNTHRAEVNLEKLWNPHLPLRGHLGLIELRAPAMPPSPDRAAAIAALYRAVAAMLAVTGQAQPLADWGPALRDRWLLPFFLGLDLDQVLAELAAAGLGLAEPITRALRDDRERAVADIELPGARLVLRRGFEPWPLVGDLSRQNEVSRLVDAGSARVELCVRGHAGPLSEWQLVIDGYHTPLVVADDRDGPAAVLGLRWRRFVPAVGLHPRLPARDPLVFGLRHRDHQHLTEVRLHGWAPGGGAYDGLPADAAEAAARRRSRVVVRRVAVADLGATTPLPARARTAHSVDTRRLPPAHSGSGAIGGTVAV
ncbi:transglutaminase family protein [Haliangium sp.]|uniref:transglutaminase family protein n=1 Tax=Haliangium sp. TaxID=2663208 RepID=UPI003D130631